MHLQMIDGALVISGFSGIAQDTNTDLTPKDFADKPLTVQNEPAFYVALDDAGCVVRSVSVTVEDRKVVAALVGNWIAEGFLPTPCDLKGYTKHLRNTAKIKAAAEPAAAPAGTPEASSAASVATDAADPAGTAGATATADAEAI